MKGGAEEGGREGREEGRGGRGGGGRESVCRGEGRAYVAEEGGAGE